MLNFNHLYYFHVIASQGSIKAAADLLGVTQPTVSEQLRLLERSLEVELFERTPSGLRLTHPGREAFEHTKTMFLAGDRLIHSLGRVAEPPELALRVGVSASLARVTASDFLVPVLAVNGCKPLIRTGDYSELLRDVRARSLDLMISETEPARVARSGLAVELIYRPSLVAIVASATEPRADWSDLALLEYRSSSVYYWEVAGYLQRHGLTPTVRGEVDDSFLMAEAALQGGFVAFVPKSVARPLLRAGQVKVLATLEPETAGIYALYPEQEVLQLASHAVALLIDNARGRLEVV